MTAGGGGAEDIPERQQVPADGGYLAR